ncbi:MAG: hypothetical protein AAF618_10010 [Pseudomonadota bacterium]
MHIMRQAVTGQLITYGIAIAAALWLPHLLPSLGASYSFPVELALGNCALLCLCLAGLKLQLVYAIVPLAGYEVLALGKAIAGGYTLSNLPQLILAVFAFVVLADLTMRITRRLLGGASHDPRAYRPRPRRAFADAAIRADGGPRQY